MTIINQIFDNTTWAQFNKSPIKVFHSKTKNRNFTEGVIVLLQNIERNEIVGLAKLGKFPEGTTLRERDLLEMDIYQGEKSKFNLKYEVAIEKVVTFLPISYDDFAFLFDIDNSVTNNICKRNSLQNCKLFYKCEEEEKVLKKINKKISIWAQSVLS